MAVHANLVGSTGGLPYGHCLVGDWGRVNEGLQDLDGLLSL